MAVTHDRYFLDNVAGWILELDRGRGIPFEGNYSAWLEAKEKRLEHEASQEKAHQRAIKSELDWVRSNPKARQAKSKARLQRFEELMSRDTQERMETAELYIPPGERLGEKVIEVDHLSKGFGDQLLIDDFECSIPQGAIVGIIGGNGAGKSTFFKMLTGVEQPDNGSVDLGDTVDLGYVDQSRDSLGGERRRSGRRSRTSRTSSGSVNTKLPRAPMSPVSISRVRISRKESVIFPAGNAIGCTWPSS